MEASVPYEDILGLDIQSYKEVIVPHRKIVSVLEGVQFIPSMETVIPIYSLKRHIVYIFDKLLHIANTSKPITKEMQWESQGILDIGSISKNIKYIISESNTVALFQIKDLQFKASDVKANLIVVGSKYVHCICNDIVTECTVSDLHLKKESEVKYANKIIYLAEVNEKIIAIEENGKISNGGNYYKAAIKIVPNQKFWILKCNNSIYLSEYSDHSLSLYLLENDISLQQNIKIKRIHITRAQAT